MAIQPQSSFRGGNARNALVDPNVGAGTDLANSITQIGGTLATGADQLHKQFEDRQLVRDNLKVLEGEGAFTRAAAERVADLDPLSASYLQDVSNIYTEEQAGFRDAITFETQAGQDAYDRATTAQIQSAMGVALANQDAATQTEAAFQFDQLTDNVISQIIADPDGAADYVAGFDAQASTIVAGLPPAAVQSALEGFEDAALIATAEGLAQQGRYDEARAFLAENGGDLSASQAQTAGKRIRELEGQHRADRAADLIANLADTQIAIAEATSVNTLAAIRQDIDMRRANGEFEGNENMFVTLTKQILAQQNALVSASGNTNTALENWQAGSASQSEADKVYDLFLEQLPDEITNDPAAMIPHVTAFVQQGGVVPSSISRFIENAEITGDDQKIAVAAAYDMALKDVSSEIDNGAGIRIETTQALAQVFGNTWTDAATLAASMSPETQIERQQRSDDFATVTAEVDFEANVAEILDIDTSSFGRTFLGSEDVVIPLAAQNAYTAAFKEGYVNTGNVEVAEAMAKALLTRPDGWAPSAVGSAPTVMRFAPERLLDPTLVNELESAESGMTSAVLQSILARDMMELGIEASNVIGNEEVTGDDGKPLVVPVLTGFPLGGDIKFTEITFGEQGENTLAVTDTSGLPAFSIQSDDQTRAELASGGEPSYLLMVRNEAGIPTYVQNNTTGEFLRWTLPTTEDIRSSPEYTQLEEKNLLRAQNIRIQDQQINQGVDPAFGTPGGGF